MPCWDHSSYLYIYVQLIGEIEVRNTVASITTQPCDQLIVLMTAKQNLYQLLVIGPLPPPLAGTSVSFKLFCDFLENQSDKVTIKTLNTAPKKLGSIPLLSFNNLVTASRVLWGCLSQLHKSNKVLLFGNNQFLVSLMPICLLFAKIAGKKFYVRCFGGNFDTYYLDLSPIVRRYLRWVLKHVDGLIVETKSKKDFFDGIMGTRVHLIPGYRETVNVVPSARQIDQQGQSLRLVYVGHINEQKGVFDLLNSIKLLNANSSQKVTCDLFGPIYDDDSDLFNRKISKTVGADYRGVLEPDQVIKTIANYDLFVFPTYYQSEGHPGVLIEAMMAGLPIVSTNFKAIPDLVEHGFNGLLVSPQNPQELADTIESLRNDRELLATLKKQSMQSGKKYSSNELIPQLLKAIEVEF